jgi:hypothetical protein
LRRKRFQTGSVRLRTDRDPAYCGAPIGVQQKLMRHTQVSTTMQYGNAYMTEKRKAHGAVAQMVLPAKTTANAEISSVSA